MAQVATANYRLDLGDERLWNGDQPVPVSNKAFQLLRLFVDNPNRLLTKDEILDRVWRDVCVSEGLVKEYVHDLRLALGDDPKRPAYIETVHGRGYRFLGGVVKVNGSSDSDAQVQAATRPPTLALLPIANLTDEERWARFCRGLGDDLITDLARFPDLMVIAVDTPSPDAAEASNTADRGEGVGTDYVLNGSVQASDTQVRVNVKLIETRSGNHVWTERYERDLGEVFAIQSDIVGHVATAVGGFSGQISHLERQRLGRKPPGDLQAYELYLLGHELEMRFERKSALRGFELLRRAVELDPDFARAWLVLGWIAWLIVQEKWTDDLDGYRALEREAFIKAAALDPFDPFALMELAAVRIDDGDLVGARDALERALDLGKNQADLLIVASRYVATILDDPERAVRIMETGLELPASVSVWHSLTIARVSYFAQDFERTVRNARLVPITSAIMTKLFEILALAQLGRADEVADLVKAFEAQHPDFDPRDFMRDHQISSPGARRLFLDGIAKAGLSADSAGLLVEASGPQNAGKSGEPLPLPDKPSVAVLPFTNLSGDPKEEYFSDGITEDIITELSRFRSLFVIARNSSFAYKGRAVNLREVGRDLGVRYLVEGSVRRDRKRLRVSAQLVETGAGRHLWAERYESELDDIFTLQDEITQAIAAAIEPELGTVERVRSRLKPPDSLDAWDWYQRGLWHMYQETKAGNREALRHFERAIELSPDFAPAHAASAYALCFDITNGYREHSEAALEEVNQIAGKAIALDDRDAMSHVVRGRIKLLQCRHEDAIAELESAIELNPNLADAYHGLGFALTVSGRPEDAVTQFDRAIRLSPYDPRISSFHEMRGWALLVVGRYEEAADSARMSVRRPNADLWAHATLCAALGHLGHLDEARAARDKLLERKPDFSLGFVRRYVYYNKVPAHLDVYLDGLRKAGLPE